MSTVHFSVPNDVKDAFNRTFEAHNKSVIIADLISKAVSEAEAQTHRKEAFRNLTEDRIGPG